MNIHTYHALPSFPQPYTVRIETVYDQSYRQCGQERIDDSCIFQHTLKGEGVFEYGNTRYRLPEGKSFLVHAMDTQMRYYYPDQADQPWTFLWLGFRGAIARTMLDDLTHRYGHIFTSSKSPRIIAQLVALAKTKSPSTTTLRSTQGAALIARLFETLENTAAEEHQVNPAIATVIKAQAQIRESTDLSRLSVDGLADQIAVSREHLSRLFRKEVGMPIQAYIIKHKMHIASRLLKHSELSAKQIAAQLGYANQANFSRSFRTHFGMSPTQFKASGATSLDY